METYLAGIRQLHITAGINPPTLRSNLVSAVLSGKKNKENTKKRTGEKPMRIPMTPNMLKLLKLDLQKNNRSRHDKRFLWATTTICFSGGFRCGEIICEKPRTFDPDTTLLQRDITLKTIKIQSHQTEILQIKLKSEKTNKTGTPTITDIYPSDSSLCPIRAFRKWQDSKTTIDEHLPAFRLENGENLTKKVYNSFLKEICGPHLQGYNGYNPLEHPVRV